MSQEYASSLLLNGYQTVDDLKHLKERHLIELNVTDPEHRHKLLAASDCLYVTSSKCQYNQSDRQLWAKPYFGFLCVHPRKHYVSKPQEGHRFCHLCIVYFCVWMKFCLFEILELDCKSCNIECHNLICFNLIHGALCGQEQTFPGLIAVWMWAHCVSRWHMAGLLWLI